MKKSFTNICQNIYFTHLAKIVHVQEPLVSVGRKEYIFHYRRSDEEKGSRRKSYFTRVTYQKLCYRLLFTVAFVGTLRQIIVEESY